MKNNKSLPLHLLGAALALLTLASFTLIPTSQDDPHKRVLEDGTVVVNTTKLGGKFCGYRDITPVEVYVKDGVVRKVEVLENYETPAYFEMVTAAGLLDKWNGLTLEKADKLQVDAVSGATFSSESIIGNVKAAITYLLPGK